MSAIRNDRLAAALDRAVDQGDNAELIELLHRNSGLPGPRPNMELARAVGAAIARRESRGDRLLADLAREDNKEYLRIVAAMTLAARALPPEGKVDKRRAAARATEALADLQQLAEDPRHLVRIGLVEAVRMRIDLLGEPAVDELSAWTDGYLQAHIALEALADKMLLTKLPSAEPVLARLDEAFTLADASPRAAERTQGMRVLRQGMPQQITIFGARYPEVITWLEGKTNMQRPETREVVAGAISLMRRSVLSDADAQRLGGLLEASAKPRRDADKVVHGTRKRGKGRM
ncbi:Hypothetical protein A7982_06760 [Minicystis rosea]|nr:Hypothetical protein A7982_06760 [Minicystis rosea]